jgi:hypothetical protein
MEREDSGITLEFMVWVTCWPIVCYLETRSTGKEADLEGKREQGM